MPYLFAHFKEKITHNATLTIKEGSPLSITDSIEGTGGSIEADKSIKHASVSFNSTFVKTMEEKLQTRFEEIYYANPETTTYDVVSQIFHSQSTEIFNVRYLFNRCSEKRSI